MTEESRYAQAQLLFSRKGSSEMNIVPKSISDHEDTEVIMKYRSLVKDAEVIFRERNTMYGNAYETTGVLGAVVAMAGDYGRLNNMVLKNMTHGRQYRSVIRDKFIDILNQCVIGIMVLDEDNWEGK